MKTNETTRAYHAVSNDWQPGEAIYSYSELEQMGCEPVWKWDCEPFETDWVSVADTLAEAVEIAEDYGLTRVLVIDWDALAADKGFSHDDYPYRNSEGYNVVGGRIDARYIVDVIDV